MVAVCTTSTVELQICRDPSWVAAGNHVVDRGMRASLDLSSEGPNKPGAMLPTVKE